MVGGLASVWLRVPTPRGSPTRNHNVPNCWLVLRHNTDDETIPPTAHAFRPKTPTALMPGRFFRRENWWTGGRGGSGDRRRSDVNGESINYAVRSQLAEVEQLHF